MRTRSCIGKTVSLSKLTKKISASDYDYFYDKGDYDEDYSVAEIFLNDFDCPGNTDKFGRNAYSILLFLNGDKIKKVQRVGHCHMCSGQGSDDELLRFPHKSLEEEAEQLITKFIT